MKQYQDERTLQVRNRIYAELMRIMLCVVVLSFCIKTLYFHMGLTQCMTEYTYDSCACISGGAHPPDGGGSGDRAGQPQARHSGYPAAAPSNSFFPAEKRMDKRGFFRTAAPCGLCASVPCDTVSFFPCGEKTGGKAGKTL